MKQDLLKIDLVICSIWTFTMLGNRIGWNTPIMLFVSLAVLIRLILSFSLFYNERRSWITLGIYALIWVILYNPFVIDGITSIAPYTFTILGIEQNLYVNIAIRLMLYCWIVFGPFLYYLVLLCMKKLEKTQWTIGNLCGTILWHDRRAQYYSVLLILTLIALLTGKAMNAKLCELMCVTLAPLSFALICKYYSIKIEKLWILVLAMFLFWYAQPFGGIFRVMILTISFCLSAFVCLHLYIETKQHLLTGIAILYLTVILPSFCIGYNQYACINYPRAGFSHLDTYNGILFIKNKNLSDDNLYGLRDRYGLLLKPEYEHITMEKLDGMYASEHCLLQKDGYSQIYDIWNNKVLTSPRNAKLQAELCRILNEHFSNEENSIGDRGEIKVTELSTDKVIGQVRMGVSGNPYYYYSDEWFLPIDSTLIHSGEYLRKDSVWTRKAGYRHFKNVLSYNENLPNDSISKYKVYIRLAKDVRPKEEEISTLMKKVKELIPKLE